MGRGLEVAGTGPRQRGWTCLDDIQAQSLAWGHRSFWKRQERGVEKESGQIREHLQLFVPRSPDVMLRLRVPADGVQSGGCVKNTLEGQSEG